MLLTDSGFGFADKGPTSSSAMPRWRAAFSRNCPEPGTLAVMQYASTRLRRPPHGTRVRCPDVDHSAGGGHREYRLVHASSFREMTATGSTNSPSPVLRYKRSRPACTPAASRNIVTGESPSAVRAGGCVRCANQNVQPRLRQLAPAETASSPRQRPRGCSPAFMPHSFRRQRCATPPRPRCRWTQEIY